MDWWVDLLLEDADLRDGHTSDGTHEEAKKRKEVCEKAKKVCQKRKTFGCFFLCFSMPSLGSVLKQ